MVEIRPYADIAWDRMERMNELGARLPGSPAHSAWVDLLEREFQALGLTTERDRYLAEHWAQVTCELRTADGHDVPVAALYPASGHTHGLPLQGRIVHAGTVHDAAVSESLVHGKVVLVEFSLAQQAMPEAGVWGFYDPAGVGMPSRWGIGSQQWAALENLRGRVATLGAIAMIVAWTDVSRMDAKGLHQPLLAPSVHKLHHGSTSGQSSLSRQEDSPHAGRRPDLPAIWVGSHERATLTELARNGGEAIINIAVRVEEARADSLLATLPGTSEETILLLSHTDGVNVLQENGPAGMLALAASLVDGGRSRRRSIAFASVTGHLAVEILDERTGEPAAAEVEGLMERHPALVDTAIAAVSIEHLGAGSNRGAVDPLPELNFCNTSNAALAQIAMSSLAGTAAGPVRVSNMRLFGMAFPTHEAGIPSMSFGAVPLYLNRCMDDTPSTLLSKTRLAGELLAFRRILDALDDVDPAALQTQTPPDHATVA